MTDVRLFALTALVFQAALFLILPRLTPRGYFFGITEPPGFSETEAGRAIRRGYSLTVGAASAIAIALAARFPSARSAAMFLPPLAGISAFFYARHRVQPFTASSESLRAPAIESGSQALPRWVLLALPPFAVPIALAVYLRAHWDEIPPRFAVHWGWDGQPNRWVHRTPHDVYGPLWFGAAVMAILFIVALAAFYGSRPSPLRIAMLKIMLAVMYLIAFVFGMVGLLPLRHFSLTAMLLPMLLFIVVILVYSFQIASEPGIPADATPDSCWRLSVIYYNPADPALFVQKRIGLGYTLNLGNPLSWLFVGALLALIPAAIFLVR